MRTGITVSIAILAIGRIALAQQPPKADTFSKTIHQLFLEDQSDREPPGGDMNKLDWSKISPRDAARRKQVRAMLEAGELKTGDDFREASFVFQHGTESDDYLMAHILATAALAKGDQGSRWLAATTLDRYLQHISQPQVFGTQYQKKKPDDPMTQNPFNRILIPAALRETFCVPNDHIQQLMLDAFQHNREPDLSRYESELPCKP
jgi:hypothetical protein